MHGYAFRLLVAGIGLIATGSAIAQMSLPVTDLNLGMHRIETEVAATQEQRMVGLMHRTSMPVGHGMIFVFPVEARHCMWMKNTLLPLSVAFLDGEGKIINVEEMEPQTENNHCAARPARYALEMNAGWFKARGAKAGMPIGGVEKLPAGR